MKKYLAFDATHCKYKTFETLEEAQIWLEERFLNPDYGYDPYMNLCKIFKMTQIVSYDFDSAINKEVKHKFIDVS
jgi:hypothetical protein